MYFVQYYYETVIMQLLISTRDSRHLKQLRTYVGILNILEDTFTTEKIILIICTYLYNNYHHLDSFFLST